MTRQASDWLADDRSALASTRILDAAGSLFAEHGVAAVTMRDVAAAVGCSRATLYRYFPGRDRLLGAYVDRTATRIGAAAGTSLEVTRDPRDRLVRAIETTLAGVRAEPALLEWFASDVAGVAGRLALASTTIESLAGRLLRELLGTVSDDDLAIRSAWLVRVMVSLLSAPTPSHAAEHELLVRFAVPPILSPPG